MEWVETTARTLDEAKEPALDQLGVAEDDAEFEVLSEPEARSVRPVCAVRLGCALGFARRKHARRSIVAIAGRERAKAMTGRQGAAVRRPPRSHRASPASLRRSGRRHAAG